ncbi:MAG: CBS domain-containing protein [Polyangiaceae bacterium]
MPKAALPKTVLVRDVMSRNLIFARADHSLDQAWATLHESGVSGAPVLDARGRLVGILSRGDLADPRHRPPATPGRVEDAMTRVLYAVRADDPLLNAVRLMIQHSIHRALVVHEDGTLAGIITPMDVLRALASGQATIEPTHDAEVEFVDLGKLLARA